MLKEFTFSLVPPKRFVYHNDILQKFIPDNNVKTNTFLKALDDLKNDKTQTTYYAYDSTIKRGTVEAYLYEYYAIFHNYFYPVFNMVLHNTGKDNILIDNVGVEVLEYSEYMGGGEYVPTRD